LNAIYHRGHKEVETQNKINPHEGEIKIDTEAETKMEDSAHASSGTETEASTNQLQTPLTVGGSDLSPPWQPIVISVPVGLVFADPFPLFDIMKRDLLEDGLVIEYKLIGNYASTNNDAATTTTAPPTDPAGAAAGDSDNNISDDEETKKIFVAAPGAALSHFLAAASTNMLTTQESQEYCGSREDSELSGSSTNKHGHCASDEIGASSGTMKRFRRSVFHFDETRKVCDLLQLTLMPKNNPQRRRTSNRRKHSSCSANEKCSDNNNATATTDARCSKILPTAVALVDGIVDSLPWKMTEHSVLHSNLRELICL
jgi:hypothetical protein